MECDHKKGFLTEHCLTFGCPNCHKTIEMPLGLIRFRDRYLRKPKAHPEGIYAHHGDCNIYNVAIEHCSCGLIHGILWLQCKYPVWIKNNIPEKVWPGILDSRTEGTA